MSFFFRDIDTIVENIVRRHLQFAFYRKSREVAHVFATAATQLVDDESGTFRKVRGGKLHHSIRVGGSGIKISRSQTHTFRSYQGIYLTGIITPGALRGDSPPSIKTNKNLLKLYFHTVFSLHFLVSYSFDKEKGRHTSTYIVLYSADSPFRSG